MPVPENTSIEKQPLTMEQRAIARLKEKGYPVNAGNIDIMITRLEREDRHPERMAQLQKVVSDGSYRLPVNKPEYSPPVQKRFSKEQRHNALLDALRSMGEIQ